VARIEQLIRTDDFDGSEAVETIAFSVDGSDYLIELNAKNAATMRQALRPFIEAGRRVPRLVTAHGTWPSTPQPVRPKAAGRARTGRVRAWARLAGVRVADRGVISAKVFALYDEAMARQST
jgi:hypothetical protein